MTRVQGFERQYENPVKGVGEYASLRGAVADAMCNELAKMNEKDRKEKVISIDSDLEGSTGADKMMEKVFWEPGLRFVFSLRSPVPQLLDEAGKPYYTDSYEFVTGKDDVLLEGKDGYIIAFGDALYRANDAAQRLRAEGIDVGLINKPTLNICDEETTKKVGSTGFALVVEPLSSKTGVGAKYGYWLAKLGLPKMPLFDNIGINKGGEGGLWEHAYEQGYDSASIQAAVKKLNDGAKSR